MVFQMALPVGRTKRVCLDGRRSRNLGSGSADAAEGEKPRPAAPMPQGHNVLVAEKLKQGRPGVRIPTVTTGGHTMRQRRASQMEVGHLERDGYCGHHR